MPGNKQHGFSLVELMIATALSLLLILLTTQFALISHRSFQMNNAHQELAESGWTALHFLRQDIQQADYWGCIGNRSTVYNGSNNSVYSPAFAITGEDDSGINRSDIIRIIRVTEPPVLTDQRMQYTESPVKLRRTHFQRRQTVVITNCVNSDIFTITDASGNQLGHAQSQDTRGNISAHLQHAYPIDSRIYRVVRITYELRLSNGIPTLYRQHDTARAQALLENIEQLQFLYGENTDNTPRPERYLPISQITDPTQIQSIQVTLTARSNDRIQHNNTEPFRQSFSAVIPVFNRLQNE
ncbi:PilW family protein [Aliamphritea hakodatensis]|uniref:PilW family protein n=1 Tax=Aliamphritea hakodatensis TaxID=2895352 RepID=UPI0022FD4322|nr:PilW family protein [Aliamphritea hakodatensis]